jgi:hypothetical protein
MTEIRQFDTWANRNSDIGKIDFEGFLSPLVLQKYWEYMEKHSHLEDGTVRDSDNWQNLFWEDHYSVCMKSLMRHVHDLWMEHRGYDSRDGIEEAMMWIMFNVQAYALKYYEEKLEDNK